MKRAPALQQLSREHHGALVLAQRIARAGDAAAIAALMTDIPQIFRDELEPHFRCEEDSLLPRLDDAGLPALAERTREEHRRLRALAATIAAGDSGDESAAIETFGRELAAHVRFEERELFPAAEALPDD